MIDPTNTESKIRNPYRSALVSLGGLLGLFSLPTLMAAIMLIRGTANQPIAVLPFIGAGLFLLFGLAWIIALAAGQIKVGRMKAFLRSQRALISWRYTDEEWEQIKEARWQEEHADWRIQLGCLTGLFGLIGLLTGLMLGAEDGWIEAITSAFIWGAAWTAGGGLIGGVLAGGSHLAARLAYRDPVPGHVALAPDEILANSDYFRGDGTRRYIREARLEPGDPTRLLIQVWSPKLKGAAEEEWDVVVPHRLRGTVEAVLPLIARPGLSTEQDEPINENEFLGQDES
jgi:hypothetical protein